MIAGFHAPFVCAQTLSAERRKLLVALAVKYDFLVLSDEPYNLLAFDEPYNPPLPLAF
eukprot:SAG31_NODE_36150_length_316_cov_0.700461_1_plen_57_part_10